MLRFFVVSLPPPSLPPPPSPSPTLGLSFSNHSFFRWAIFFKIINMKVRTLPSLLFSLGAILFSSSQAQVTVYYEPGVQATLGGTATVTGAAANYTGAAAYNPTTLTPPSPPGAQALPTQFAIQPPNAVPPGASILQNGSFFGFSIEMSVVNQVG